MDKFWKWMYSKSYGFINMGHDDRLPMLFGYERDTLKTIYCKKIALIGYMMEYLDEASPHWGLDSLDQIGGLTPEGRYVLLKSKIEDIDNG